MYGDISRLTFDRAKRYSRVVYQQGRVFLDADPNEQTEILLDLQRSFIAQLVGQHGGPPNSEGFRIKAKQEGTKTIDLEIGEGPYYVDGILCECGKRAPDKQTTYFTQDNYPVTTETDPLPADPAKFLAYLDVWERHVSALEDASLHESALGGPDTAARTQVVWQVKVTSNSDLVDQAVAFIKNPRTATPVLGEFIREKVERTEAGRLAARLRPGATSADPCAMSPGAQYRGLENQLYRVEIHAVNGGGTTYKWSRDNGSVVFGVLGVTKNDVRVASFGRDATRGLVNGSLVELINDDSVLRGTPGTLTTVIDARREEGKVTVEGPINNFDSKTLKHPLLRRWDGTGVVNPGAWHPLEAGIEIQFGAVEGLVPGDYWLIPARTAAGQIEWPVQSDGTGLPLPGELPPLGIRHHYAPLALVGPGATVKGLRNLVSVLTKLEKTPGT